MEAAIPEGPPSPPVDEKVLEMRRVFKMLLSSAMDAKVKEISGMYGDDLFTCSNVPGLNTTYCFLEALTAPNAQVSEYLLYTMDASSQRDADTFLKYYKQQTGKDYDEADRREEAKQEQQ